MEHTTELRADVVPLLKRFNNSVLAAPTLKETGFVSRIACLHAGDVIIATKLVLVSNGINIYNLKIHWKRVG